MKQYMTRSIITHLILCGIMLASVSPSALAKSTQVLISREDEATSGDVPPHSFLRHQHDSSTIANGPESIDHKAFPQPAVQVGAHTTRNLSENTIAIRLNAGGHAFTDAAGNAWEPDDAYANTGRAYKTRAKITGTPDQELYQTERWKPQSRENLQYVFSDLPMGKYNVKMHFSENYWDKHYYRAFSVSMQNKLTFKYIDIFAETGAKFKPLVKTADVAVYDGTLLIEFKAIKERPKINGIEIVSTEIWQDVCLRHTIIDFSKDADGNELLGGAYVSREWEAYGMVLSAAGGHGDLPRLFNTSDPRADPDLGTPNERCDPPGPGRGEGGEPDMPGENCKFQGNVLIIQEDNRNPSTPNDSATGGTLNIHFPKLAEVYEIGLLDIDYASSITLVLKNKAKGYRKSAPFDVALLGDNSYQLVKINQKKVKRIVLDLSRSGAITSISFCAANNVCTDKSFRIRNRYDEEFTMEADEVQKMYDCCIGGAPVILERTWVGSEWGGTDTIHLCPSKGVTKEENTFDFILDDNRTITFTCPGDDTICTVSKYCHRREDCRSRSCDTSESVGFCNNGCEENEVLLSCDDYYEIRFGVSGIGTMECDRSETNSPSCHVRVGEACVGGPPACATGVCGFNDDAKYTCGCSPVSGYPCDDETEACLEGIPECQPRTSPCRLKAYNTTQYPGTGKPEMNLTDVDEMYQCCLEGGKVTLDRKWQSIYHPESIALCPGGGVSKTGTVYAFTRDDGTTVDIACEEDTGNCLLSGDGMLSSFYCFQNGQCKTDFCTYGTSAPRTGLCLCNTETHAGCEDDPDGRFFCGVDPSNDRYPHKCFVDVGAECYYDHQCFTKTCDALYSPIWVATPKGVCGCSPRTNYPCDVEKGEKCVEELVDRSYLHICK